MEQTMNSNMQPAKRGIKKSWIILGIVVVLVLWMFSGYNGLVENRSWLPQSWLMFRLSISVVLI